MFLNNSLYRCLRLVWLCVLVWAGCQQPPVKEKHTTIKLHLENAYNKAIYLETIPWGNESKKKLDSVSVKDRLLDVVFNIADSQERNYQLRSSDSRLIIPIINDVPEILVKADYFNPADFEILQSPANASLQQFLRLQKKGGNSASVEPATSDSVDGTQMRFRNYVDTVSSAGAALYVYNAIDFGKDYGGLKKFVTKLAGRFPSNLQLQRLKGETLRFVSIFEEEWKVGDQAPDLSLPDSANRLVSVSAFRGKYVLIDFWSPWDPASLSQLAYKDRMLKNNQSGNLLLLSIALDPEKDNWKQLIRKLPYKAENLIDEKVWLGEAVNTFKFDSIPFNFLIDPSGKIIAKALYNDSLVEVVRRLVK